MSNYPTALLQQFAEMFKALSNPHRLHIFLRLISCCPPGTRWTWDSAAKRHVGQLAEEVSIAASTVSHHIKELRNAGMIKVARRGKNIECWMNADAVNVLADLLAGRFPEGLLRDESSLATRSASRGSDLPGPAAKQRPGSGDTQENTQSADACCGEWPALGRLLNRSNETDSGKENRNDSTNGSDNETTDR